MIKHFCDICGKETSIQRDWNVCLPYLPITKKMKEFLTIQNRT